MDLLLFFGIAIHQNKRKIKLVCHEKIIQKYCE
jgi:hypothetical protein